MRLFLPVGRTGRKGRTSCRIARLVFSMSTTRPYGFLMLRCTSMPALRPDLPHRCRLQKPSALRQLQGSSHVVISKLPVEGLRDRTKKGQDGKSSRLAAKGFPSRCYHRNGRLPSARGPHPGGEPCTRKQRYRSTQKLRGSRSCPLDDLGLDGESRSSGESARIHSSAEAQAQEARPPDRWRPGSKIHEDHSQEVVARAHNFEEVRKHQRRS